MPKASLADHVMVFANALPEAHCRQLIDRFEASPEQQTSERDVGHSFDQIDIARNWPDQNEILLPLFRSYFNRYQTAVNTRFWPARLAYENLRMKRYRPDGRDGFPLHVDVMASDSARRFMTAFIYLNTPEGGETVFPSLNLSITPETGKLLAFPPLWLFPHAGLPPRTIPKYILHTYLWYP